MSENCVHCGEEVRFIGGRWVTKPSRLVPWGISCRENGYGSHTPERTDGEGRIYD